MTDDFLVEQDAIHLEDAAESADEDMANVIPFVLDRYKRAEDFRYQDEARWIKAYRNYRGLYGSDVQFSEAERSRVFIKVTKTKTLAAYGQIVDVLFANNKFPLSIDPTQLPDGVVADVHFDPKEPAEVRDIMDSPYGFSGDGNNLKPGDTQNTLKERMGEYANKLDGVEGVREGVGKTGTAITFSPAMVAAKRMQKKIHDQLEESGASKHLRSTAFEMALFGTGVMKGPFAVDKEYPNWDDTGEYTPTIKTVPQVSHVSVWNFYPDPDANNMDEAQYAIERHKLSRTQLRALKKRPYFRDSVIEEVITRGENYDKLYWEDDLSDYAPQHDIDRFEVIEYWGTVDTDLLEDQNVVIPKELRELDELQACLLYTSPSPRD